MSTKLTIRWDGTAPGLQEHALSLSAWLKPLGTLLKAVRRAASNLDGSRDDDPERGRRGGRHTPAAAAIDLQITGIRDGCVNLDLEAIQVAPGQQTLTRDLPARALVTVVGDIKAEAAGYKRSALAQRFLKQLPAGLTEQGYRVEHDGVVLVDEHIADSVVESTADALPRLQCVRGLIAGVGFDPPSISFRTAKRHRFTMPANEELVQQALDLREQPVEAMCLAGQRPRVIWVRKDSTGSVPDGAARSAVIRHRWARTLEILGE